MFIETSAKAGYNVKQVSDVSALEWLLLVCYCGDFPGHGEAVSGGPWESICCKKQLRVQLLAEVWKHPWPCSRQLGTSLPLERGIFEEVLWVWNHTSGSPESPNLRLRWWGIKAWAKKRGRLRSEDFLILIQWMNVVKPVREERDGLRSLQCTVGWWKLVFPLCWKALNV